MQATYAAYNLTESVARIDEILDSSDYQYTEHKGIPPRERLTFTNGFYVDVTVLFVDLRGSKSLGQSHTRPVLAKIYRTYISEVIAVLRSTCTVNEIYIEGDGLWAVYNTTTKSEVDSVFDAAARLLALVKIINIKLSRKNYKTIKAGIGLDDATSLYIKAGYKHSGINEVVWLGDVVGKAALLCKSAARTFFDDAIMVSSSVYDSLSDANKRLLSWNSIHNCYSGDAYNTQMSQWIKQNE